MIQQRSENNKLEKQKSQIDEMNKMWSHRAALLVIFLPPISNLASEQLTRTI